MIAYDSNPTRSDTCPSQRTSPMPSNTRISDPAETLMVVDHDPMVCDPETRVLRLEGYTVLAAGGSA
jgi:hypothetical protein